MLARRSKLIHNERGWDLPLLVPSFSSKGADSKKRKDGRLQSDVAGDLRDFGHSSAKTALVSAYDLHFHHLDLGDEKANLTESALISLRQADLVFLDSGGYELVEGFDASEPKVTRYKPRGKYGEAEYRAQVEELYSDPNFPHLVLTNFDYFDGVRSVAEQVESAKRLFVDFPEQMHSFILKPWGKPGVIELGKLSDKDIEQLRAFDIVGVTEKELGAGLWDRVRGIARLRKKLKDCEINAPLHIWGGLDPVITPLYFFAGAQIFDGMSWLRYGYFKGVAISKMSYQILADGVGVTQNRNMARGSMTIQNRLMLENLETALQLWVEFGGKNFSMFDKTVRVALRDAFTKMRTLLRKEGV